MPTAPDDARDQRIGALQLAGAMAIAGTIGIFVERSGQGPLAAVFYRCLFGTLFLALVCGLRGHFRDTGLTPWRLLLVALGGVAIVVNWVAFFAAIRLTSITLTTIVYHVQPFWVVLLGSPLFKERVTGDQLAWMLAAFAGLALATVAGGGSAVPAAAHLAGVALALGASLLYAVASLAGKALKGVRPQVTALLQTALGTVLLLPLAQPWSLAVPATAWFWLAGLGIVHTGIVYGLMYAAYPKLPSAAIAILAFVYPVVAMLSDWLIDGRAIGPGQLAGIVLIALGSLGVNQRWRLRRVLYFRDCINKTLSPKSCRTMPRR